MVVQSINLILNPILLIKDRDTCNTKHTLTHKEGACETEQVVVEYAVYLGIDVQAEGHLLWIAEEGLRAPLPDGYSEHADSDGAPLHIIMKMIGVYVCL